MNFVLKNIEVFVVIVQLNKPKGTNTENYLREFKLREQVSRNWNGRIY